MDQALSETNLKSLLGMAGRSYGCGELGCRQRNLAGQALAMFGKMKLSDINASSFWGLWAKIGRDTERLLIAGKNADALV